MPLRRVLHRCRGGSAAWIDERFEAFVDGLAPLRPRQVLLLAAVLSLGVWMLEGASYVLLSRGMNLGLPPLDVPGIGLALVTINLGIMVPSGPGYVGRRSSSAPRPSGVVGAIRSRRWRWWSSPTSSSTRWSPASGWCSSRASTSLRATCGPHWPSKPRA